MTWRNHAAKIDPQMVEMLAEAEATGYLNGRSVPEPELSTKLAGIAEWFARETDLRAFCVKVAPPLPAGHNGGAWFDDAPDPPTQDVTVLSYAAASGGIVQISYTRNVWGDRVGEPWAVALDDSPLTVADLAAITAHLNAIT